MPLFLPPPNPLFFSASSSSSPLHFSSISQPCLVNGFSSNLFCSLSSPPHIQVPNPSSKFIVPFSRDSSSVFFLPSLFLPRLEPSFKPGSLPHTSNKLARLIAGICREQFLQRVRAIRQDDRDANEANDDNGSGSAHPLTDREYSSEGQVEALDSSGTGFGSNENGAMGSCVAEERPLSEQKRIGSNVSTLLRRFWKVAAPYWSSEDKVQARLRLAAVFALTLGTTGISVGFNFLGRDFYNALASKDQEQFTKQLLYYLGAFAGGIPVFVLRDYGRDTLALRWRAWMTSYYMDRYFKNRTFYQIQSQSLIDNPDQRIVDDLNSFSGTALSFSLALFNATIDLISFSGILFGIYPPLFLVLIVYSIGGTAISIALGKDLVNLNFLQEKKEADFRYGLVRVRENAESIAFYGGEKNEIQLLLLRFRQSFENFSQLLVASRNLEFFTSGYRYLIQILPAALVAPMYFSGKIEFGVINQSYSAFNHVLGDFSIIVYQFQAISAFSAVIDRLGEFGDILDQQNGLIASSTEDKRLEKSLITMIVVQVPHTNNIMPTETNYFSDHPHLLEIEHLTLQTPQYTMTLVKDLSLVVQQGQNLLIMGASGSGKTSLMRAIAGLWRSGSGLIKWYLLDEIVESDGTISMRDNMEIVHESVTSRQKQARHLFDAHEATEDEAKELHGKGCSSSLSKQGMVFFLPQRPYLVLGTLRQQLLYPTWVGDNESNTMSSEKDSLQIFSRPDKNLYGLKRPPTDEELVQVLEAVRMGHLMDRCDGLDSNVDWTSVLSLGEQQRIAFARLLLSRPRLALLDESTSAMDEMNEAHLYKELKNAGITYISIGHRSSLRQFHLHVLTILEATQESPGQNWILEHLNEPDASKPFSPLNV